MSNQNRPADYGLEFDTTFEHEDHGELTVISRDAWPIVAEDSDGETYQFFEFQVEEFRDNE